MTTTTITCSNCGTVCAITELVCTKCGNLLFDPSTSTVHMRVDPSLLRLRRTRPLTRPDVSPERSVTLLIRGMKEKLVFEEGTEIILGRTDINNANRTRLDLTVYGAHERGVSREHALLRFRDGALTVTDLNSVNGTAVNLQKLTSNVARELRHGDELMLGRLPIMVHYESEPDKKKAPVEGDDSTVRTTRTMFKVGQSDDGDNPQDGQRTQDPKPAAS